MYKIDYLSNYIKKEQFLELVDKLYNITACIEKDYPNYKKWFYNTHINGCILGSRNTIFITYQNKIVGLVNLKKEEEVKISTIYVLEEYRNKNISNILLEQSLNYLETTTPFITINKNKLYMFGNIIKKYNWKLTEIVSNYYKEGSIEYCFNGSLSKNKTKTLDKL